MYTIHKSVNLPMLEVGTYVFRVSTLAPECTRVHQCVSPHVLGQSPLENGTCFIGCCEELMS